MKPSNVVLSTYTGETVRPLGEAHVSVEYMGSQHTLPLLVVREGTTALFGRNWLSDVKLDLEEFAWFESHWTLAMLFLCKPCSPRKPDIGISPGTTQ